ncbi:MAG: hypothetical protein AUG80_02325 [Candidatus Rokubacteria bacterium 13_1_20CM_4_68_9]|nr:MAG: hypothetical protein AUG80_02325 [Candidatus Rokubacteria bacterium 13_1_20CM_4_68_9]
MLGEQPGGAGVEVVRRDDVIAGRERLEHGHRGRRTRAERRRREAALEVRQAVLQRIAIRVAVPGVQVPSVVTAIDVTLERRRRMDGAHDRASGRVHAPAGMYGPGLDAHGMTLPVW